MTKRIVPLGKNILVLPLPLETYTTEEGIQFSDNEVVPGEVLEVSAENSTVYKKGDRIRFAKDAGLGQYYKGQNCLWIHSGGFPEGHVFGIISDENDGE